jgi:hypothetical protein
MEYFQTSIHTPEGVGLYTLLQVFAKVLHFFRIGIRTCKKEYIDKLFKDSTPKLFLDTSCFICICIVPDSATKKVFAQRFSDAC